MFFLSFLYERTVLSLLEKLQQLPAEVQVEIAKRVDRFISLAKAVTSEPLLTRCVAMVMEEQAKAIGQGVDSTLDPRLAAPALAEAWCTPDRIGQRQVRSRERSDYISAIENFAFGRPSGGTPD
jgi:hypothetical protein